MSRNPFKGFRSPPPEPPSPPDPPSSHFKVGDLCRVVPIQQGDQQFAGLECTILTPLNLFNWNDGGKRWAHQIELQNYQNWPHVLAEPHVLRKLPPPNTKTASWDECPFKPKEVEDVSP